MSSSSFLSSTLGISPKTEEWLVRIIFTIVLMVSWHFYLSWTSPTRTTTSQEQGSKSTKRPQTNTSSRLLDMTFPAENVSSHNKEHDESKEKEKTEKEDNMSKETTSKKKNISKKSNKGTTASSTTTTTTTPQAQATAITKWVGSNDHHPGLEGFWYWADIEMSLFRIYNVGRNDGVDVIPPYIPKSRAGTVAVSLQVKNATYNRKIAVYWVNFKGREERKTPTNTFGPGAMWTQTTWLEHPWVFRDADTDEVLLHYIPERVIPHTALDPTVDPQNPHVGLQRFSISDPPPPPPPPAAGRRNSSSPFLISVDDPVLPFPAQQFLQTPEQCIAWTLLHLHRMQYSHDNWNLLTKYLTNIVQHPDKIAYRQVRVANAAFFNGIWNTPARGLLLALGFVERFGYAELGRVPEVPTVPLHKKKQETNQDDVVHDDDTNDTNNTDTPTLTLSRQRVQDVSKLLFHMEWWRQKTNESESSSLQQEQQPEGADGSGRAGFGIAGATKDFEQ